MIFLYQLFFPLVGVFVAVSFLSAGRGRTLREGLGDLGQRLGRSQSPPPGKIIWIHAASVGEVLAAKPFVEKTAALGGVSVVMTTSTRAGRDKAASLPGVKAAWLAPMDFFACIRAFLRRVNPSSLVLVETEIWPMTLILAARAGVRIGIVNGRIPPRAFARYQWIRPLISPALSVVEKAALQSTGDLERFVALGLPAEGAAVLGNMKYDLPRPDPAPIAACRAKLDELGWSEAVIFTAGSTRPGEEEMILKAFLQVRASRPNLRLILVPRHPERAEAVVELVRKHGEKAALWSQGQPADIQVVDSMGLLPGLYAAAKVSFVGGTLMPVGGHNLLEPAAVGRPVLFGPYTESLPDVAEALLKGQGGFRVADSPALARALEMLLVSERMHEQVCSNAVKINAYFAGAAERSFAHLIALLEA